MMNGKTRLGPWLLQKTMLSLQIVGFLLAPRSTNAQWQQVFGPTGEDVEAIESDAAGHIYAGTDIGVYVSSNNGLNWSLKDNGLLDSEIFSFAATSTGAVLAGTEGGGIFRSTNFGDTWAASSTGLPDNSNILSMASDRRGNLFAGHSTQGVFYSSDDGIHWSARNSGMETQTIFALAIAPSGTIYAGAIPFIFTSTDQGQHWDTAFTPPGPMIGSTADEVLALAADSLGDIIAGTWHGHRYRLRSGSNTWDDISPATLATALEVKALAASGSVIFAGLFGASIVQSSDVGNSWIPDTIGLSDPKIFSLTAAPSGYLFAGTFQAEVFRSNRSLVVAENASSNLFEIWPQPFQDKVHVSFTLAKTEMATIEIFDALGREVLLPASETMPVGSHERTLDLPTLPSGMYLVVLRTPSETRQIECACVH
ncbi:MAG TPA: T9SS type A sorting domain-containing protein [Candidatus Kapabacteria bacterium]|nr:T9SS type A sorting domain-containing protein [Candidatus Kapabacteria bacterium]